MGLVYVAAAWGFLQGLEYLSESFNWPHQVRQVAVLALVIGLPIVLVLAWYHGDRGQQRISTPEFAILTLLLLLGGGAFWYYQRASDTPDSANAATSSGATTTPPEPAPLPDEKSIAVLPFADMSPQKDQEYMSDGIAEELLNLLAKVPDLKVIARTSSFAFKGEKIEIAEMARKLNVAHVLEGSVRKSGNKVRITAQLIRTADSTHLWSETYDRALDDIFAIQDEIAGHIVQALEIRLSGTLSRPQGGTQNREAYELYLRAWNGEDWYTESSLDAAERYLQKAIELDPAFSTAWSTLAAVNLVRIENGYVDAKEGFERVRQLTQHALELNPTNADAHDMLSSISHAHDWDWLAAERESQRALAIDPTNPGFLNQSGRLSATFGRWDDAVRQYRAALDRDPVNGYVMLNLGLTYHRARRFAEAESTARRLLEIKPGFPWTRSLLGPTLVMQGRPDEALAVAQEDPDEGMRLVSLPAVLWAAGRRAESDDALRKQIEHWEGTGAYWVALSYAYRGDPDLALEWLERAYKQRDAALIEILGNPLLDSLADDPRFKAFLQKMKLPEWPSPTSAATST